MTDARVVDGGAAAARPDAPSPIACPRRWPLPERGVRVLVPFGPRRVIGVVTGAGRRRRPGRALKDVARGGRRGAAGRAAAARPRGLGRRPLPGAARRVLPAGPAARGRARQPRRRAAGGGRGDRGGDPVLRRAARRARCPSRRLAHRLGRDPERAPRAAARAKAASWSSRTCDARRLPAGARRRAAPSDAGRAAGTAQAEVLRAPARGRRPRAASPTSCATGPRCAARSTAWSSAGAVRDRGGARAARARRCWPAAAAAALEPHRGPGSARSTPLLAAVGDAALRAVPAARRHRQRQDRGLLPRRRARARAAAAARSILVPEIALTPLLVRAAVGALRRRRWPCCTASCRRASATTSGGASARARRASWSARAPRCSRPLPDAGPASSWTRSTRPPTSRRRARATTRATWP